MDGINLKICYLGEQIGVCTLKQNLDCILVFILLSVL